jgi:gamma-glutamylcyclotransferase (GGCT)/AIG2-like uncharacterized protein YtfP
MDLDAIIASINKKLKTFNATPLKLEELDLSEAERSFDQQYKPGNVLIVYGTLAPGRPNYPVIEHIKGNWQQGIVRGKLIKEGWGAELGCYAFKHVNTAEQEEIKAFVLTSDELISNWQFLDEFEGSGYRRILANYELDNGEIGVGFIYAVKEEDTGSAEQD